MTRRAFLSSHACGIGSMALWSLLARDARAATTHHPARARRVIFLFMEGGPSQLDLLDPKPEMAKWDGQPLPESMRGHLRFAFIKPTAKVWASRRPFRRHGRAGIEISDWLPNLARVADQLCVVRSMFSDQFNHHPGQLLMHCGTPMPGRPSMGAWLQYGLGSESDNLPGFVVLNSGGRGGSSSSGLHTSGFLPSQYQGVPFAPGPEPVAYLANPAGRSREEQRARLDAMRAINEERLAETGDEQIASRIASYELAFRMQAAAPELLDLSSETAATRARYGLDKEATRDFGANCLLARRMVERGVRFVLVSHTSWDDHGNLVSGHSRSCAATDQPCAALVEDLRQRGLLEDTLVIWGGEFGRTPLAQTLDPGREEALGRDHHPDAFTMWLAGGGVRAGQVVGRTDDLGLSVVEDKVHVHDLHATILHLLGIDHTRLTWRHQGRDFRLTDVAGTVVAKIVA